MMEHFVTLFDSLFLPQGLALHMSMQRHVKSFTLWILCVDDEAYDTLARLNLVNVQLLQLSKLETTELKHVKPSRTKGEYCWTLTPFTPKFVFESAPSVQKVTYIDADIWFYKNPSPIFEELNRSGKSVLITEHAYAAEHDQTSTSGRFCVQFMTFKRDTGENVRKWWEERCLEWCFARFENGKFGDQKYLDIWPEIFQDEVHILEKKEFAQAPWNATRYPYSEGIFWHFHGLRLLGNSNGKITRINYGNYHLPKCVTDNIYSPYCSDLIKSINLLKNSGFIAKPQKKSSLFNSLKFVHQALSRKIKKLKLNNLTKNI